MNVPNDVGNLDMNNNIARNILSGKPDPNSDNGNIQLN